MAATAKVSELAAAGVVRCPPKPASLNHSMTKKTLYPDQSLQNARSKCCTQTTFSVPVKIQSNIRQNRTWGSREWFDVYGRLRPAVESFFSIIKDPGKEHMSRGRIKMMGLAKPRSWLPFGLLRPTSDS